MKPSRTIRVITSVLLLMGLLGSCGDGPAAQKAKQKYGSAFTALDHGDVDAVMRIVDGGTTAKDMGETLILAAQRGDRALVTHLLDKGANVNYVIPQTGLTALMATVDGSEIDMAKYLHAKGANVDAQNSLGMTALASAVQSGSTEMVSTLLALRADQSIKNNAGETAMTLAADPTLKEGPAILQALAKR